MMEFNTVDIVSSFAVTWGIGLAPPLLIRYGFLKRAMNKWPAIGTCAAFWFFNIIIFTALGSQSRTHSALILIAFASYWILRKTVKENKLSRKKGTETGPDREEPIIKKQTKLGYTTRALENFSHESTAPKTGVESDNIPIIKIFCTQCRIQNPTNARFCWKCGHDMHRDKELG